MFFPGVPKGFRERYERIVDDWNAFSACLTEPLPKTFRINTLKADARKVMERLEGYDIRMAPVPWYDLAFTTGSEKIGATLEHFTGRIYIQEGVSMVPPLLLRKELEETPEAKILDACAAPGSKTTQLSAMMRNRGLIVANDARFGRLKIVKHNAEKLGCMNVAMINKDMRFFTTDMRFDFIMLDAPCSSEGIIRKNWDVLLTWNEKNIFSASGVQKQLLARCYDLLKPGGAIIYSTCTFAPEENEGVIDYILGKRDCALEAIRLNGLKTAPPVKEWNGKEFDKEVGKAARVWPHHNDTGGFFVAKIRKAGGS